ncbi:MAG: alpha/beta fold hydrolase [Planctomycetes bacterium]|nr:alpha/beta fold hydrolase [Planctomycetota bacterium]
MPRTLILLAHGAGAGSSSAWMRAWAARLGALGQVVPFDYPYMREGRKAPDRLPKLIAAHRDALRQARADHPRCQRVVLCGKSMGSRVGCHLSLEEEGIDALVCLGYPLVSIGKAGTLRDAVLRELRVPILFVQGTRDRLAPLETLEAVRAQLSTRSALHVVETGDHSLQITKTHTKATGQTQEEADARALEAVRAFLATLDRAAGRQARP